MDLGARIPAHSISPSICLTRAHRPDPKSLRTLALVLSLFYTCPPAVQEVTSLHRSWPSQRPSVPAGVNADRRQPASQRPAPALRLPLSSRHYLIANAYPLHYRRCSVALRMLCHARPCASSTLREFREVSVLISPELPLFCHRYRIEPTRLALAPSHRLRDFPDCPAAR